MLRRKRTRAHRSQMSVGSDYITLECRRCLAGIVYNASTKQIEIDGGTGSDRAIVSEPTPGIIRVELSGFTSQNFPKSTVAGVVFWGRAGNDYFQNLTNKPSFAYGHSGTDTLLGGFGPDNFQGGTESDHLDGGDGHDILRGNEQDDLLKGGTGNDQLYGVDGRDQLYGGSDSDQLYGGLGDDTLLGESASDLLSGQEGNDIIDGGTENDLIWGDSGSDSLQGGNGNDSIYAGDGDDILQGGLGSDKLYGGNGNDRIYGDGGDDLLYGEAGIDGLFGGVTGTDRSHGGTGPDRFLIWGADVATDFNSADGKLAFLNRTSSWTDAEIKVLDAGLHLLHVRVGSSRIIRDSLDNDPVVYSKWSSLGGSLSTNYLKTTVVNGVTSYDRELKFAEWNENNSATNDILRYTAIHEIGHSWDSVLEINNRIPGNGGLWNSFLGLSSWKDNNPNSTAYTISLDGEWWYRSSTEFVRYYSRANPREDWSTVWEIYFDPTKANDRSRVQSKVNLVSTLFDRL